MIKILKKLIKSVDKIKSVDYNVDILKEELKDV